MYTHAEKMGHELNTWCIYVKHMVGVKKDSSIHIPKFFFYFCVRYSALLHRPSLGFRGVGGCWDRARDSCDYGSAVITTRLDLISSYLRSVHYI
jgi:hypothetical protein